MTFVKGFFGFLCFAVYVIGFIYLMNAAIFDPVEVNADSPVYSWWWIGAWILYICLGGATWVWIRTEGPLK